MTATLQPVRIPKHEMSHEDWLAARRTGIGASEIAAACGLSPYQTPFGLWEIKTGRQPEPDLSENEAVELGNELEETVARLYTKRTGRKTRRSNFILRHPDHEWMLCNLDRVIVAEDGGEPEILECKTAGHWAAQSEQWGEEEDACPEQYLVQVQQQLAVTGRKRGFVAVLFEGQRFRIYTVERNEEIIGAITRIGAQFWDCVKNDTPPPAIDVDDAKKKWPFAVAEKVVEADNDALALYREVVDLKTEIKEREEKLTRVQGRLCDFMGDAELLQCLGKQLATWKQIDGKRFSEKMHAAEAPDCHTKFTVPSVYRRFMPNMKVSK